MTVDIVLHDSRSTSVIVNNRASMGLNKPPDKSTSMYHLYGMMERGRGLI